jgi:hypothetical protein
VKSALASAKPVEEQKPVEKKPEQPADKPAADTPTVRTEKKGEGDGE